MYTIRGRTYVEPVALPIEDALPLLRARVEERREPLRLYRGGMLLAHAGMPAAPKRGRV